MKEMTKGIFSKNVTWVISVIFLFLIVIPTSRPMILYHSKIDLTFGNPFELPNPLELTISLETAICRRMSIREFTGENITDEELSTILWHAYGFSQGETRNIHGITNEYPITIYVLARWGVWRYNPTDHTLIRHRRFDMTWIGQYDTAPIKIALIWDRHKSIAENFAGAEIGEICQNIYFACNALNLGTVTTASEVNQLYFIGLSANELPRIIMPIGHLKTPYQFTYEPIQSDLPFIINSTTSLTDAVIRRKEAIAWDDTPLTLQQQTQVIWSSYGYSYYVDNINNKRHKTVPSSHGTYPFSIYCINHTGIFRYHSETHQLMLIKKGDHRGQIANASEHFISSAPLIIIPVLNMTNKNIQYLWAWYYEAAAAAYNVLLEGVAWNLSANIILKIDTAELTSVIELNQEQWLPLFVIPVGKQKEIENYPPHVVIKQPQNGLYIFGKKISNCTGIWILGPYQLIAAADDDQCFKSIQMYINGKAVQYSNSPTFLIDLPPHPFLRRNVLKIKAYDYEEKSNSVTITYMKIF